MSDKQTNNKYRTKQTNTWWWASNAWEVEEYTEE